LPPSKKIGEQQLLDCIKVNELRLKIVKSLLDTIILTLLTKYGQLTCNDTIVTLQKVFNISLEEGTVHSSLYLLEVNGLIQSEWNHKKCFYRLTEEGKQVHNTFDEAKEDILRFARGILYNC
jgi:DNA-binding transcriptional regulator PaaX